MLNGKGVIIMGKTINPKAIAMSQELEKSDKKALSVEELEKLTGNSKSSLVSIATSKAYEDNFVYLNKDKSYAKYNGKPTIELKKALTIQGN